ncbi:MAG: tetratricopeptide repeat protein [Chthoniobacterales bacterium]
MKTFNVRRFVLVLMLVLDSPLLAETNLEEASRSLSDGVPQVAVVRLRALLATKLSEAERTAANAKLGEALIAAEEPAQALQMLAEPPVRDLLGTKFFRAQALAALARWDEALIFYQQSAADSRAPFHSEAIYGQAESLRALGKVDEALAVLDLLARDPRWTAQARLRMSELLLRKKDEAGATRVLQSIAPEAISQKKERRLLRGRIEARRNRDNAIDLYDSILKSPTGTTHSVLVATLFAIAQAHLQSHTPEAGDNFLEEFIEHHPADEDLPALFAKLDQLYAAQATPSLQELRQWSNDPAQPRRGFALWYLARQELRLHHRDRAREAFAKMRMSHPQRPVFAQGLLQFAEFELRDGHIAEAMAILGDARALHPPAEVGNRIEMLLGASHYTSGEYGAAAQSFRALADATPQVAQPALFNASLAWLQAGDATQAEATGVQLKKSGADEQTRGELRLDEALLQATRGDKEASESLQKFTREFPKHPRVSEAFVALAELAFHAAPPRLEEARQTLSRAAENKPTAAAAERADYLMIWLADAAPETNEPKVIALAQEFLQKYDASPSLPDVRLKLAEIHYRRQDFASAQTQFEILAQRNPDSPIAEKALFFAAKSAVQTMGAQSLDHALVLFDEVVKENGELKWAARNEQAVIERKLGKAQDAVTLYDEVLKGNAQPAEKREALCAKADILYEQGASDRENYRRAIELYDQLANQPETPAHWRNQALFKKGMCLEKLSAPAEALATFYRIVGDEGRPEQQREFFWYYKAGFNAARLLEEEAKWEPAAAVYEKLAFAGGARSDEAKSRLKQLRLEHFLWDQ